jgi:hypothetical protein
MLRGLPLHGEILTMIVQSLRHAGWPVLLALASVVACSKKAATPDAFVNASLGPTSGSTLCPLGPGTPVLSIGAMQASDEPMTVPEGVNGVNVDCTVAASGDGFDIQLSAAQPGSQGGNLIVNGHVNADGGTVSAQFVSQMAGSAYTATNNCTLTYKYLGQAVASGKRISAGSIFAHISCPNAEANGGSISGQQVMTPDGGFANAQCDGEADILFQNCAE